MARAAVCADEALLFGLGEHIHHGLEAFSPIAFREAMHQADVNVVGSELFAKALEIGASRGGVACPGFCEHGNFVPGHVFQGLGYVRMAAVGIRAIKESQAVVVTVQKQVGQPLNAQRRLVGVVPTADRSSSHGQPACLNARASERNRVRSAKLPWERGKGQRLMGEARRREPGSTGRACRSM